MLSNPIYLLALAGLSVPIAVHLLSQKEGKIIKLGSIRHVVETTTQQFKGLKLNEILLLLLRCSMVVIFSLLLSGLSCSDSGKEKWVIVDPRLLGVQTLNTILDSLAKEGYAPHLLTKGFPKTGDSSNYSKEVNYWQLASELRKVNISQAIVLSQNNINSFKGLRSTLPPNVRWLNLSSLPSKFPLKAVRLGNDSVALITGYSDNDKTYFKTEIINTNASPIPINTQDTVKISLVSDVDYRLDCKVIKASLKAIEKSFPVKIVLYETNPANVDLDSKNWCFWFSAKVLKEVGGKNILQIRPQESNDLITRTESSRWMINSRLNQDVALTNNLTVQLAKLLLSNDKSNDKIFANDQRMVSDSLAWWQPGASKEVQASIQYKLADNYLVLLLVFTLIVERVVAYKKNQ